MMRRRDECHKVFCTPHQRNIRAQCISMSNGMVAAHAWKTLLLVLPYCLITLFISRTGTSSHQHRSWTHCALTSVCIVLLCRHWLSNESGVWACGAIKTVTAASVSSEIHLRQAKAVLNGTFRPHVTPHSVPQSCERRRGCKRQPKFLRSCFV